MHCAGDGRVGHSSAGLQSSEAAVYVDHLQVQVLQPRLGGHGRKGGVRGRLGVIAPVGLALAVAVAVQLQGGAVAQDGRAAQRRPRQDGPDDSRGEAGQDHLKDVPTLVLPLVGKYLESDSLLE